MFDTLRVYQAPEPKESEAPQSDVASRAVACLGRKETGRIRIAASLPGQTLQVGSQID